MRGVGKRLVAATVLLAAVVLSGSTAQGQIGLSIDDQIIELTNLVRTRRGLPPLRKNAQLTLAAAAHSQNMARLNVMSHNLGGSGPGERIRAAGYDWRTFSENVAVGQRGAEQVMQTWLRSPPHLQNILSPRATEIGVGVAVNARGRLFFTLVVARPR